MENYYIIVSLTLLACTTPRNNWDGKSEQRYTHGWWKTGQPAYPDDRVELCHGHLFGSLHSLDHLLLMLPKAQTRSDITGCFRHQQHV